VIGGTETVTSGRVRLGILPWNQATDWPSYEASARRVDALGYDHLWAWDHLYAIFGDPYQPIFEGWTTLAAWAKVTERVRLGLLVGANTFRNPGLVAKMVTTLDHLSGGRAILGLGGAWFELEHTAHDIEFGSGFGERLDWMHESLAAIRTLLDGGEVTSADGRYRLDMWNAMGRPEKLRHKAVVLERHCAEVGRDPAAIERTVGCKPVIRDTEAEARRVWEAQMAHNRTPMANVAHDDTFWIGTPQQIAERMAACRELGFSTFIAEMAAPYDIETLERWIGEVKPMVDRG
jgi:alkanesulfonate monooxygenase SsuD/methylene tetrahydromethanopterin reductase-like flavin-dependent oxidoreductase (luciferase family)